MSFLGAARVPLRWSQIPPEGSPWEGPEIFQWDSKSTDDTSRLDHLRSTVTLNPFWGCCPAWQQTSPIIPNPEPRPLIYHMAEECHLSLPWRIYRE